MNLWKKYAVVVGLIVILVMLGACSGGGEKKPDETTTGVKEETKTPVELTMFNISGIFTDEEFEKYFFQPLKTQYPHITIKVLPKTPTLDELVASGNSPDILLGPNGDANTRLTKLGLQQDITSFVTKYKYDTTKLHPAYEKLAKMISDGKLYGLPLYAGGAPIYYNKDLFDKFGVPYPTKQMTWDELYALSQRLTRNEGGVQYYGFLPDPAVLIHMNQKSLPLLDATGLKPAFNIDNRWKTYLEPFKRYYDFPGSEIKVAGDVLGGKALTRFNKDLTLAMFLSSNLRAPASLEAVNNWDLMTLPTYPEAPNTGLMPYAYFGFVTSTSKHQEEAFQALAYFASEPFQMMMSEQALLKPVMKSDAIIKAFATKSSSYGGKNVSAVFAQEPAELATSMFSTYHNIARNSLLNEFNSYVTGGGDINTLMKKAEDAVIKSIQTEEALLKAGQK